MSEIRKDELFGRYVIFAPSRNKKPTDFISNINDDEKMELHDACPFCPENKDEILNTLVEIGKPWKVKVVENKYPVVEREGSDLSGYHYVVIECREHNKKLNEYSKDDFFNIFLAYRNSLEEIYKNQDIKTVKIFKNYKSKAGASLKHQHSQIIALNVDYNNLNLLEDECYLCKEIQNEIRFSERIIIKTENFICYAPYASTYNYEIRIAPLKHKSSFLKELDNSELLELASVFKSIFTIIYKSINDVPLNICYFFKKDPAQNYHMFIEITPRISMQAGFEVSSGIMINSILPEKAASLLKGNK